VRSILASVIVLAASPQAMADPRLDALVAAYPDVVTGYDGQDLILKSGQRIRLSDGNAHKTPEQRLDDADIDDMFADSYPLGIPTAPPTADPGRARNKALFDAIYGDCRKGEVEGRLASVRWLPGPGGQTVRVTRTNGVARELEAVAREVAALPGALHVFLVPSGGTFNCRAVAGTERMSMHAYGAAIDINPARADYWRWGGARKETDKVAYRNRVPAEIVSIFERHGFIWGGKWVHYDTMHFEYRPEILATARAP
jgi:hypothetical protein